MFYSMLKKQTYKRSIWDLDMKICFVAPANNYHIKKWCKWFVEREHEIHVVSFIKDDIPGVTVHFVNTGVGAQDSDSSKIKYLLHARKVRRILDDIKADIVNAHYATSYGTVMALSGYTPYVLSVWGSDIYDFPQKSPIHKAMLKFSLIRAKYLFSTSRAMADEGAKYTKKKFEITPFGVDMELFNPGKRYRDDKDFVIGTVKSLTPKYGIDYLLKAVALIVHEHKEMQIKVRIAGNGSHEKEYKELAKELGISSTVTWLGHISQERAAKEWANMDLGVVYSTLNSESFGVSAVESQACATPVIISDIPGLMEATLPGETSIVVPRCSESLLAEAIFKAYEDKKVMVEMGRRGEKFVRQEYELNNCFMNIENLYRDFQKAEMDGVN